MIITRERNNVESLCLSLPISASLSLSLSFVCLLLIWFYLFRSTFVVNGSQARDKLDDRDSGHRDDLVRMGGRRRTRGVSKTTCTHQRLVCNTPTHPTQSLAHSSNLWVHLTRKKRENGKGFSLSLCVFLFSFISFSCCFPFSFRLRTSAIYTHTHTQVQCVCFSRSWCSAASREETSDWPRPSSPPRFVNMPLLLPFSCFVFHHYYFQSSERW